MATHRFTPSQVTLLMEGYVVDEAHTINYEVSDDRTPIYGFRSETFDAMSFGRTLVYGTLDIHFIYKGYLMQAIAKSATASPSDVDDVGDRTDYTRFEKSQMLTLGLDPNKLFDSEAKAAFLSKSAESFNIKEFDLRKDAIQDDIWGRSSDKENQTPVERKMKDKNYRERVFAAMTAGGEDRFPQKAILARPSVLTTPIRLSILYGKDHETPLYTEHIEDVYFRGQTKVITASVQGSETPILERYQFIARTVT